MLNSCLKILLAEYYKILHRRNSYNVKFLADYLALLFSYKEFDFDSETGIFSVDRKLVGQLYGHDLNRLSKVISKHSYYDAFVNNKFLIIPHVWKK